MLRSARESETTIPAFEKVREIIAESAGVDPARVTMDSDLAMDIGVAGDDGDELFAALDKEFDVDWTGLELGVHFGNEGWGLPLPWHLKDNRVMFEPQPCRVSDIVRAVETGRWPGTKLTPRPKSRRVMLYLTSTLQIVFVLGLAMAVVGALLFGWFTA